MSSKQRCVLLLDLNLNDIGGKATGLQKIMKQNLPVPETWICNMEAYQRYKNQDFKVLEDLSKELLGIIQEDKRYIIRSSGDIEDTSQHSFAGQLKTVPSVKGVEDIVKAIKTVWDSASSNLVQEYSTRKNIDQEITVTVIIQEMLHPDASGVVFTRNPINGDDEIIVEAVSGSSDTILQKGANPERWLYRQGEIIEKSVGSSIDENIIKEIIETSENLEKRYGIPLDLEWILAEGKVWWIQLREITTSDNQNHYSNIIASEQLPGLIKPLIWSINIPLVCGAWINLIEEMMGPTNLQPNSMAKQFYCRAYYNMTALGDIFEQIGVPRDSLEVMMGYEGDKNAGIRPKLPLRFIPRILSFIIGKTFFERKLEAHLLESEIRIKEYEKMIIKDSREALEAIDELFQYNQEAAYYVIVSQLLHSVFHRMLRGRITKRGMNFDDFHLESNLATIDPRHSLAELNSTINFEDKDNLSLNTLLMDDSFRMKYNDFLEAFGHLSDSGNDFSQPTWSETPEHVLKLIQFHHDFQFDPHTPESNKDFKKWWLYRKTKKLHGFRERISFNYVKSYGLFRKYFLTIDEELVNRGDIEEQSDIFYLTHEEVRKFVLDPAKMNKTEDIAQIKEKMRIMEDISPPSEIFGEEEPPIVKETAYSGTLNGISASSGYYQGFVRHIKSIKDFEKVERGDAVVIPFSDISWSPIFSKAGAIISESGGLLSHAAVVAREYKIPAVVGVKNAFSIPEGSQVIIDGYKGIISCIKKPEVY